MLAAHRRAVVEERLEGEPRWLQLHSTEPDAWGWFGYLIDRVIRFGERYPTDIDVPELAKILRIGFATDNSKLGCWAVIDTDSFKLVGHLIATIENRGVEKNALIWQAECDVPLKLDFSRECLHKVGVWARLSGAANLEMYTVHDPRLFARAYGFKIAKYVLHREVK